MIFQLTEDILSFNEEEKARLLLAIANAFEHNHFVDFDPLVVDSDWIDKNLFDQNSLFSAETRELLLSNQERWDPNGMHKRYLRTLRVGNGGNGTITPIAMSRLIMIPSLVFVENSRYDGAALAKWVRCYQNDSVNKAINQLVAQAFKQGYIIAGNGGGCENIANAIYAVKGAFKGMHPQKITAVFDSDKTSKEDPSDHKASLKRELEKMDIEYHELQKREVENYFHTSTYIELGLAKDGKDLSRISGEEWDYAETNENSEYVSMKKSDVEKLVEKTTKELLQERVYWEENKQDEIHEIILLLARYI